MQRSTSIFSDFAGYKQYLIKILLQGLNLLYFLAGMCLVITGTIVQSRYKEWAFFTKNIAGIVPAVIVFSGLFMIIVAFLGCCGSVKESPCLLLAYCSFLIIVFSLQMVTAITSFSKVEVIKAKIKRTILLAFRDFRVRSSGQSRNQNQNDLDFNFDEESADDDFSPIDYLQRKLACCGPNNYTDWDARVNSVPAAWSDYVAAYKESRESEIGDRGLFVPATCCLDNATLPSGPSVGLTEAQSQRIHREAYLYCGMGTRAEDVYQAGCISSLQEKVMENVGLVSWLAIGIASFEVFGVILSCILFAETKKTPYDVVAAMRQSDKSFASRQRAR